MSLKFDADVYTRAEADEMLRLHGLSLEGLLDHFKLRTTYKSVVLGAELRAIFEAAAEVLADRVRCHGHAHGRDVAVSPPSSTPPRAVTTRRAQRSELAPFSSEERAAILKLPVAKEPVANPHRRAEGGGQ